MRDELSFGANLNVFYFDSSGNQTLEIHENDAFTDSLEITNVHHAVDGNQHLFSFTYANLGTGELTITCTQEDCEVTSDAVLAMTPKALQKIVGVLFRDEKVSHKVAWSLSRPVFNETTLRAGTPEKSSLRRRPTPSYLTFDEHSVLVDEDGIAQLTLTQLLLLYEYGKVT